MCGTSEYSVTELREHHAVCGATGDFRKILDWFWTAVANMSEEEKARLLQFTTGCSQLPPGILNFYLIILTCFVPTSIITSKTHLFYFNILIGGFRELSPLFQITPAPIYGNLVSELFIYHHSPCYFSH